MVSDYPTWICSACGAKYGKLQGKWPKYKVATWHYGICDICGKKDAVTEPRDFGHLEEGWEDGKVRGVQHDRRYRPMG